MSKKLTKAAMNSSYHLNNWNEVDFQSWHDWIGNRVSISGSKEGVLKYFGETKFADGMWCGIELDEPLGKNDGSVKGVRYFTCKNSHGIFVPLSKTVKLLGDVTFSTEQQGRESILPMPSYVANLNCHANKTTGDVASFFLSNDNVCPTADSVSVQDAKRPLNESYLISVEDQLLNEDILNTTVILGEDNNLTFRKSPVHPSNKTFTDKNPALNATFDLDLPGGAHKLVNENEKETLEGTFILDEQNNALETNANVTLDRHLFRKESSQPKDNDEKPSFLSLSQMKDFTVCLDASFCDNFEFGKSPQKEPSVIFFPSVTLNEVENKAGPKSEELEDLTLHAASEAGYKEFLQEMNTSALLKSTKKSNYAEDLEHSFHLGDVHSSTPDQSKTIFIKKMSLIQSFQLEESIELDDCLIHESDGQNSVEVISGSNDVVCGETVLFNINNDTQLLTANKEKISHPDCSVHSEQPCKATFSFMDEVPDFNDLLLEGTEGISVLLNESIGPKDDHKWSNDIDLPNGSLICKKNEFLSLTKDVQNVSETHEKSGKTINEKDESLGNLRKSFISSNNDLEVGFIPKVYDSDKGHANDMLDVTIVNDRNIESSLKPIPDLNEINLENNVNFEQTERLLKPATNIELNHTHPIQETDNTPDQIFNSNSSLSAVLTSVKESDAGCGMNYTFNSSQVPDKNASEPVLNRELNETHSIHETKENALNQTFNFANSLGIPSNECEVNSINTMEKHEKESIGQKESDLQNVSKSKSDGSYLNTTVCIYDQNHLLHTSDYVKPNIGSSLPLSNAAHNLNATICLSEERDQNVTFDMRDIADVGVNVTNTKSSSAKKMQPALPKNVVPNKDACKFTRPKNLPLVNPKRQTLPAVSAKIKTCASNSSKQDNMGSRTQKKPNKWDTVTSKITSNFNEEKLKPKKEVSSKLNTNLKISRLSHSKQSLGIKTDVNKPAGYDRRSIVNLPESKAMKNAYNYQRVSSCVKKENVPEKSTTVKGRVTPNVGNKSFVLKENTIQANIPEKSPDEDISSQPPATPSRRDSIQSTTSQSSKQSSKIAILQKKVSTPAKPDVQNKIDQKFKAPNNLRLKAPPNAQKLTSTTGSEGLPNRTLKKSPNQTADGGSKRPGLSTRFSSAPAKPSRPAAEPKKFVSKTELVKEIQTLTANCESRTKEMNFVQIHLRRATLGFEALATLTQYVTQEMDPFSQNRLMKEMANTEAELTKTGAQLKFCLEQIEQIKNSHADDLDTLSKELEATHLKEIRNLKRKHSLHSEKTKASYKDQLSWIKRKIEKKTLERRQRNELILEELKHDCEKHMQEQRELNAGELEEMSRSYSEVQSDLKYEIKHLKSQNEQVQKRTKQTEEKFLKDKNSRVQRAIGKMRQLEQEAESLKAVLDMKSSQLNEIRDSSLEMKTKLKELRNAKEDVKVLETKAEDLQRVIREKTRSQRALSMETHDLDQSRRKEWKLNRRLSFTNEELKWRLRQTMDYGARSASVSDSLKASSHGVSPVRSRYRSRNSLPTLQYEDTGDESIMTSSLPPPTLEEDSEMKCHPMSSSLIASLPSRKEELSQGSSKPRRRSSSARNVVSKFFRNLPRRSTMTHDVFNDVSEIPGRDSSGESSPDLSSPKLSHDFSRCLSKKNSISWTISDVYEDFHENCVLTSTPTNSKDFEYYYAQIEQGNVEQGDGVEKEMSTAKVDHSHKRSSTPSNRDHPIAKPRSLSTFYVKGIAPSEDVPGSAEGFVNPLFSENFHDLNKNFPLTTRKILELHSEEAKSTFYDDSSTPNSVSSPSGSSDSMSFDVRLEDDGKEGLCPKELAGESMVHDVSVVPPSAGSDLPGKSPKSTLGGRKPKGDLSSENTKDRVGNSVSFSTPSMELSSQCSAMTDSTNIDVSWGDDEISAADFSK